MPDEVFLQPQRWRSAGAEGDPMQRPVKRPAAQLHLDLLFESTVMSHPHPRIVNWTVESDNSVNPAMCVFRRS
jgi:hypothetical protein